MKKISISKDTYMEILHSRFISQGTKEILLKNFKPDIFGTNTEAKEVESNNFLWDEFESILKEDNKVEPWDFFTQGVRPLSMRRKTVHIKKRD